MICDKNAIEKCRRDAIEFFFDIFLGKLGLRQTDLCDNLIASFHERAFGRWIGKKWRFSTGYGIIFQKARSALKTIYRAGHGPKETLVSQEEDLMQKLRELCAGLQFQLESILSATSSSLRSTSGSLIPPRIQQHFQHHVFERTFQRMIDVYGNREMDLARGYWEPANEVYVDNLSQLRKHHSFHQVDQAKDGRGSPFDPSNYDFIRQHHQSMEQQREQQHQEQQDGPGHPDGDGDTDSLPKPPSKRKRRSSTSSPPKQKGRPSLSKQEVPQSFASVDPFAAAEALREALAKEKLVLVDDAFFRKRSRETSLILSERFIFKGGLMEAAAFLIRAFLPSAANPG